MKEIKSAFKFLNYVVDSVVFKNNLDFEGDIAELEFHPSAEFNIDGNDMLVFLTIDVFNDAQKNNYPFEMSVSVVGYFKLMSDEDVEIYKANAVAVLFPFVRAIISTYTAAANVNPLILPTVNINKILEDNE